MAIEIRPYYDLQRACVSIKILKYIASSPVRSLDNLDRFVVGRRFCLLFVSKILYFKYKKCDAFILPCNFLTYSFDWNSEDRLRSE